MSFPSSAVVTLEDVLRQLRDIAANVKALSLNIRAQSLTGLLSAPVIQTYMAGLKSFKSRMAAVWGATGLPAYAQAQLGNSIDIVAEYNTMISALDATVTWIAANLPKDGSNYLLSIQVAVDGTTTDRVFTSGALSGLRTQIDALTVTIG